MLATIWESCYKRFFHDQNNLYHIRNWVFYINLNNIYDSKADPNCLFLKRHKYLFSTILRRTSPSSKIDLEFPQQLPTTRLDIIPKASNGRDSRAALQTQVATSRLEHVAVHLERLPPYVLPKINHLHLSFCGRLWWHLCLQKSPLLRHVATLPGGERRRQGRENTTRV